MEDFTILDNLQSTNKMNIQEDLSFSVDYSEDEWNYAMCNRQTFSKQKKQIEERRQSLQQDIFSNFLSQNDQDIYISIIREEQEQNQMDFLDMDTSMLKHKKQTHEKQKEPNKNEKRHKAETVSISDFKKDQEILTDTDTSEQIKFKQPKVKKQNKKVKKLGKLLCLLQKWFKGQAISSDNLVLNQEEKIIFLSIIKRKFKTLDYLDSQDLSLEQILQKVSLETTRKRPEENIKFIFKKTLKSLKKKFQKNMKIKCSRSELDDLFYRHFFGKISQQEKIPLQHFYHPNSSQKRTLANFAIPKTINNQYIGNIVKSKEFLDQFLTYVQNEILEDYSKVIDSKLKSLTDKWEKTLQKKQENLQKICIYIQYNKKCKLPWNAMEIKTAEEQLKQLFTNIY